LADIRTGGRDTQDRVDNGPFPFYVRSQKVERIDSWSFDGEAVLTAGDGAGVGKVFHYATGKFDFHQRVYAFSRFNGILGRFFFYYFSTHLSNETSAGTAKSTVDSLRRPMLQNFPVPVPDLQEQGLIVRYLDHAELRIAKAIAAKQDVVRLLREARLAMISETVLAGNGTDVERMESGIPGVGPVPAHWRIRRAKYVWNGVDVRSVTGTEERLTVSSASGIVPRSSKNVTMFEAATYVGHKVVQPNDLVINSLWAWAGGLGVSNHHGLVSPVYGVYRLRDDAQCDPEFMHNLLRSNACQWQFQVRSKGIWRSRLSITDEAFFDMPLPLPPLEEQRTIAAAIRTQTSNVDRAIASVLDEIALLKEYRTRLISDVVTGKLDVRDEAAKLPDVDPMELVTVAVGENGDDEEATDDD
jgi:type I restriction enzyme S subunit